VNEPSLERGEILGRVRVPRARRREALVTDARGRPLLAVDRGRLTAAGAMHGDLVVARRLRRTRRTAAFSPERASAVRTRGEGAASRPSSPAADNLPPGLIVRVVERANPTVVGTYRSSGRDSWVVPDDDRLSEVDVGRGSLGALPDEKVVAAISRYPGPNRPRPVGQVVERLGASGDPDSETLAIIRSHGLRDVFPKKVLAEAEALPREVDARELGTGKRLDLTGEIVFTIDDVEARDLDDAVSLSAGPDGTRRLGVHIADVAHYVREGSALDLEALERGTSVYLVDRVLPMFPPRLSNGIASLHPDVDRLTVSVLLDIDERGRVISTEVRRSIIRSVARLTYDEVAAYLRPEFGETLGAGLSRRGAAGDDSPAGDDPAAAVHPADHRAGLAGDTGTVRRDEATAPAGVPPEVRSPLVEMARLAEDLRRRRMARGSLDLDFPEEKVKIDEEGRPVEVISRPRSTATQIIEEFMIAANEAVADFLLYSGVPFISRVHEEPFRDDLETLRETLAPLGYRVPTSRVPRPGELQAILEAARGRPEAAEVNRAVLRTLPLARYSAVRIPHYALGSPNYTHFTSPIRRYPDLTLHRQVAAVLEGRAHLDTGDASVLAGRLAVIAESCSVRERAAEAAERESVALKKAELAHRHLGLVADGEVVDVFSFGAFVRLPIGVDGLVPAATSDTRGLRVGDVCRVQIVRVDIARRQVELALV